VPSGAVFMIGLLAGAGYLIFSNIELIIGWASSVLSLTVMLLVIGALLYVVLDPRARNLVWYMYKSMMRWITGLFVQIDPIGILKSYVEDLADNLAKMRKQIGAIRGQMRQLQALMEKNDQEIQQNLQLASAARDANKEKQLLLSTRKAARLKETNAKYQSLYNKMDVLRRILDKMHQNSEILLEDTKDQVKLKEQERKAIRASHSAMKSAMSVISGDPDKRAMFDAAMESITEDVANKVGEMEEFMEMSADFMDSVDLQNGIFEEKGLQMLEEWEKKSTLLLLNSGSESADSILDLDSDRTMPEAQKRTNNKSDSKYDNLFD
ncbi:MAG: hypothetical protein AAFO07_26730, partial [Bacteroidota bacterium]